MYFRKVLFSRPLRFFMLSSFALLTLQLGAARTNAQDTVTGAFEGSVKNSTTGAPIAGASIQFINQLTGVPIAKRSDSQGRFYQGLLPPGTYTIRVNAPGFKSKTVELRLLATRSNSVIPVPVSLDPESATATPTPTPTSSPGATVTPSPVQPTVQAVAEDRNILSDINTTDARRSGAYTDEEVSTLPLGGRTIVRSFDELALLLPGVAAAPVAIGNGTGPGVGSGVGTSGQFSVNGLRSRANNFTVDGSDNNDEDIGVRRQGFFALVPQPIESIQEFQIITLLAPAQFGRNIGAQVNAVSKSGGNETHGTIFGFFNSSQLNARNVFDSVGGNTVTPLTVGARPVIDCTGVMGPCTAATGRPLTVRLNNGGEDSFTLGHGGFVLGGSLMPNKLFYFISAEGQVLNANKEVNFAVPTIPQRGVFGSGATGLAVNPFTGVVIPGGEFPTTIAGDAIFSFFPFPNNPTGVYGGNTFTQVLPSSAQGKVVSGKLDYTTIVMERRQDFTARYNFTDDWRDIPVTGGGLFSRLRPRVRTQNFSTFWNSELSGPNSTTPVFNQLRLSYGRTRLKFDEGRDENFLLPARRNFNNAEDAQFLLNTRFLSNLTLPGNPIVPYATFGTGQVETALLNPFGARFGPVGQINIAGFSPIGVDVNNFPQKRVNNTYQVADTLTWRKGSHNFAFGKDIRRTELISDLPRNARPLMTFNGAPRVIITGFDPGTGRPNAFRFANAADGIRFIRPEDYAAAGAPSGFFQSLVLPGRDSHINLRYYQLNFFAQDEWRVRPNLSLSFGLRYEYNTPPREAERRIESTFGTALPTLVSGLANFISGRSGIFDPDRNNFAPRVGFAYSPHWFGPDRTTVIRAGYGLYYDQILGAVVSQSRNVFPTFTTINFGGGCCNVFGTGADEGFNVFNPLGTSIDIDPGPGTNFVSLIQPGTLNTLNPVIPVNLLLSTVFRFFPSDGTGRPFGATLPARNLQMPMAHEYSMTFEQQLSRNMVFSASYVGTTTRHLLRFTTPNLGPNYLTLTDLFIPGGASFGGGIFSGITLDPGSLTAAGTLTAGRPVNTIGPISQFETTASSRYDALQLQARGRLMKRMQYQVAYTYSRVEDDVSDVFDLAGASALPQNSRTFAGERGLANFDARHRFSYNFIYEFPEYRDRSKSYRFFLGGLQIAGSGSFHTGQPFTVNSLFDINLDGNLTDRLNSIAGIVATGDRSQPIRLTPGTAFSSLVAAAGTDGSIGRNTFRAGNVLSLDVSFVKKFAISERQNVTFRMDVFNFIDRANYGIPVRFLEAPGFGRAVDTVTPGRRVQFALKYTF